MTYICILWETSNTIQVCPWQDLKGGILYLLYFPFVAKPDVARTTKLPNRFSDTPVERRTRQLTWPTRIRPLIFVTGWIRMKLEVGDATLKTGILRGCNYIGRRMASNKESMKVSSLAVSQWCELRVKGRFVSVIVWDHWGSQTPFFSFCLAFFFLNWRSYL